MERNYNDTTLELHIKQAAAGNVTSVKTAALRNRLLMTIKLSAEDWRDVRVNPVIIVKIIQHYTPAGCVGRIHLRGMVCDYDDYVFNAIGTAIDAALDGKSPAYEPRPLDYSRKRCTPTVQKPRENTSGDAEYAARLQKMQTSVDNSLCSSIYAYSKKDARSLSYDSTPCIFQQSRKSRDDHAHDSDDIDRLSSVMSYFESSSRVDDYYLDDDEIDWRQECEKAWPDVNINNTFSNNIDSNSNSTINNKPPTSERKKAKERTKNIKYWLSHFDHEWLTCQEDAMALIKMHPSTENNTYSALFVVGFEMKTRPDEIPTLRPDSKRVDKYITSILANSQIKCLPELIQQIAAILTSLPTSGPI